MTQYSRSWQPNQFHASYMVPSYQTHFQPSSTLSYQQKSNQQNCCFARRILTTKSENICVSHWKFKLLNSFFFSLPFNAAFICAPCSLLSRVLPFKFIDKNSGMLPQNVEQCFPFLP